MGFLSENPCGQQLLIAFNFIHWSSPGSRKPSASVASLPTKILTTFEDFMKGNSMKFPEVSQQNIQTHPNSSELSQLFRDNSQLSGFPSQDQKPDPIGFMPGHHFRAGVQQPCCCGQVMGYPQSKGFQAVGRTLDETVGVVKMGYAAPQNGYFNRENDINTCIYYIYWPYESIWYMYIYIYIYIIYTVHRMFFGLQDS